MKDTFRNISNEKQRAVIDAAFKEFASYGYKNASTNRLVKELGISKGSLFKYFHGKLDLYSYLVDIAVADLVYYMEGFSSMSYETPKENILAYAEFEYDYLISNPEKYWFFYRFLQEMNNPELLLIKEELTEMALVLNNNFLNSIGVSKDKGLRNHLKLILAAYNQLFLQSMGRDSDWRALKDEYLDGLRSHLSYVDWRS